MRAKVHLSLNNEKTRAEQKGMLIFFVGQMNICFRQNLLDICKTLRGDRYALEMPLQMYSSSTK